MDISSYYFDPERADDRPLPLVPASARTVRQKGQSMVTETNLKPIEQTKPNSGSHLEAIRAHLEELEEYIERLETQNQLLKEQVDYYRQKEETSRAASEKLRNDLEAIDLNFV
jgi:hypothetical protein